MFEPLILSISKAEESGGLQPHPTPAPEYPYFGGEAIFLVVAISLEFIILAKLNKSELSIVTLVGTATDAKK